MATQVNNSARTTIEVAEASEIARQARGSDPNVLAREDMQALLGNSALVLDSLRSRPRYFDGRFLTGADLTRDQDYIRQRQADLARASGTGVVDGLHVRQGTDPAGQTLDIGAGHGITPSGDIVMIASNRSIVALDLPASERLDVTLGLSRRAAVPLGRRTGLFILALRSVEFTANPISAYPTSITGQRRIEDGDIIEATAITLIPWTDTGGAATLDEARRTVARQVFTGHVHGLPEDALPLAMVAMDRGSIRWIDEALVRRETGADTPLQVSIGGRPRALAEAFVLQHQRHLADVLQSRAAGGLGASFAANQYFAALPAAGQLPAASILSDTMGFRQLWFPPACDVEISFAPIDEIAALVEESLTLPPIDLLGDPADLDATGIVVMVPVTRARLQRFEAALAATSRPTLPDPAQGIRQAPADMLASMLARRTRLLSLITPPTPQATAEAAIADSQTAAWTAAWNEAVAALPSTESHSPLLWYFRRRAVADRSNIVGVAVAVGGDDETILAAIGERAEALGFTARLTKLNDEATPFAEARIAAFLGSTRILKSDLLLSSAVHDLEAAVPAATPAPSPAPLPSPGPVLDIPLAHPSDLVLARTLRSGVSRLNLSRLIAASAVAAAGTQPKLSEADVIDVASDYAGPRLGDGLDRLSAALATPIDSNGQVWIGGTGLGLALDGAARDVSGPDFAEFAKSVTDAVTAKDAPALGRAIGVQI